MNYDTLPTICAAVVAIFALQSVTVYAVVKLLVTGRTLVEKREQEPAEARSSVVPWAR